MCFRDAHRIFALLCVVTSGGCTQCNEEPPISPAKNIAPSSASKSTRIESRQGYLIWFLKESASQTGSRADLDDHLTYFVDIEGKTIGSASGIFFFVRGQLWRASMATKRGRCTQCDDLQSDQDVTFPCEKKILQLKCMTDEHNPSQTPVDFAEDKPYEEIAIEVLASSEALLFVRASGYFDECGAAHPSNFDDVIIWDLADGKRREPAFEDNEVHELLVNIRPAAWKKYKADHDAEQLEYESASQVPWELRSAYPVYEQNGAGRGAYVLSVPACYVCPQGDYASSYEWKSNFVSDTVLSFVSLAPEAVRSFVRLRRVALGGWSSLRCEGSQCETLYQMFQDPADSK